MLWDQQWRALLGPQYRAYMKRHFGAVVLPAFERSSQEMFRQVDDAFRRGITECEC